MKASCWIDGMVALPGETVPIELTFSMVENPYDLYAEAGAVVSLGTHRWNWIAPRAAGPCRLVLADSDLTDFVVIDIRVTPREEIVLRAPGASLSPSVA